MMAKTEPSIVQPEGTTFLTDLVRSEAAPLIITKLPTEGARVSPGRGRRPTLCAHAMWTAPSRRWDSAILMVLRHIGVHVPDRCALRADDTDGGARTAC